MCHRTPAARPVSRSTLLLIALLSLTSSPLPADDDHEQVHRLRNSGQLVPMVDLLDRIRRDDPEGEVIEVELERGDHGGWEYEIEVLGRGGRVSEWRFNASDGTLLEIE